MVKLSPETIMTVLIAVIFTTAVLNPIITAVLGINTTGMSTGAIALVGILDLIIVAGIATALWRMFK